MASIMVEYSFENPMSDERLAEMAKQFDACLDVRNGTWVRSSVSKDRKRMVCEFEAPDAESVREALRSARQTFDRVWPADVYPVENYPELLAKLNALRSKANP